MKRNKNYNEQYKEALYKIYNASEIEARGVKFKEVLMYKFEIDPYDNIINIPGFETNINYAKEELAWYYSGKNVIDYSDIIRKTWYKYSDNGVVVNSAYGFRIYGKGRQDHVNQWKWCLELLKKDPGTRQAIININNMHDKIHKTKDFPCTIYFQLFIRDKKLIWITNLRSQDIYFGTRNDVYCFTEMHKKMARELKITPGVYIHLCNSLHLYTNQYTKLNNIIKVYSKEEEEKKKKETHKSRTN